MLLPERCHAFSTTVRAQTLVSIAVDKNHRQDAIIEQVFADLKVSARAHLHSGYFESNSARLVLVANTFNLTRAAGATAGGRQAGATTASTGINDPRARLSSSGEFEGYVMGNDLAALTRDFLPVPSSQPNVLLHVVDHAIGSPAPLGVVIADLAARHSPRAEARVARLLGRQ